MKKQRSSFRITLIAITLFAFIGKIHVVSASILNVDDYLNEVLEKHTGIKASKNIVKASDLKSGEGTLLLAPTLYGGFQYTNDERPTLSPAFQGTRTVLRSYSLGVSKLTRFGLEAKLSYGIMNTKLFGVSPAFVPQNNYYDTRPTLELSQSLGRNFFGKETRAKQDLLEAQTLATGYQHSFQIKALLAEAENAYYRLSIAQSIVDILKDSLDRAKMIQAWNLKQVKSHLGDDSDLLQSNAAVKVKDLELQSAIDDLRVAVTSFNSLRNIDSAEHLNALTKIDAKNLLNILPPERSDMRDDVRAVQQLQRAAGANAEIGLQQVTPVLEVYSSVALNGRNEKFSEASSDSFTTKHPLSVVGLRLSAPIDLPTTFSSRKAHQIEKIAAEESFSRKIFEQEQEWNNLNQKFNEFKTKLRLSTQIIEAQKEKLVNERSRHLKGRSTTYQVLLFEQDYAASRLAQLNIVAGFIEVFSRMKTFGGQYELSKPVNP